MKTYIGTKIIQATPMDHHAFLRDYKAQEDKIQFENQAGYLVEYEDGYISWSPRITFENAYRELSDGEERLLYSTDDA